MNVIIEEKEGKIIFEDVKLSEIRIVFMLFMDKYSPATLEGIIPRTPDPPIEKPEPRKSPFHKKIGKVKNFPNFGRPISEEEEIRVTRYFQLGYSTKQISGLIGRTKHSIESMRHFFRKGLPLRYKGRAQQLKARKDSVPLDAFAK